MLGGLIKQAPVRNQQSHLRLRVKRGQSLRLVACRYLLLMRCEGGEDFSLLPRRHFGEVKAAPQLGRYLVEFFWRDLEATMCLFKAQMSFPRLCWREFERPARDFTDPFLCLSL